MTKVKPPINLILNIIVQRGLIYGQVVSAPRGWKSYSTKFYAERLLIIIIIIIITNIYTG